MRLSLQTLAAAAALSLSTLAAPAFADNIIFNAELMGADEVPPVESPGTGSVLLSVDDVTLAAQWTIEYEGLSGPVTAAHFHGPANPGENAPPAVPIDGDLASPISGEATLTAEQFADLKAGKWYLNLHTEKHPGGEVRGQLVAQNPD